MKISERLDLLLESDPLMMGSFAIQTDHPGLMKSIKKRKTKKVDRSPFMNVKDAEEDHIAGTMDASGRKQTKIEQKINKRLENL